MLRDRTPAQDRVRHLLQGRVRHPHARRAKEPLAHGRVARTSARPGPIIDFQAPLSHTLVPDNIRKKGAFEKMFLEGRPPVNVGVTSSGDVFGGTQVTLHRRARRQAVQLLRRVGLAVPHAVVLVHRTWRGGFQYALQGFSQTQFFYGQTRRRLLRPGATRASSTATSRMATQTVRGGTAFGIYPFNRYRRVELSGGVMQFNEEYNDPALQQQSRASTSSDQYGQPLFRNGTCMPLGVAFVAGDDGLPRVRPARRAARCGSAYEVAPKIGDTAVAPDARRRRALLPAPRRNGLLALRVRGFKSWGEYPDFLYFGGNSEMRGYDYLQFVGQKGFFANAELRFPLIEAVLTPIGVLGGLRGVFFANIGGAGFDEAADFNVLDERRRASYTPIVGYESIRRRRQRDADLRRSADGVSGFRLVTAARRTASASRPSRSASRSTSTGRGGRCSTRTGRTCAFAAMRRQRRRVPQAEVRRSGSVRLLDQRTGRVAAEPVSSRTRAYRLATALAVTSGVPGALTRMALVDIAAGDPAAIEIDRHAYLLRNLWPTMPPSWKPSSALGALRFSTTTGKLCEGDASNARSTPGIRNASRPSPTCRRPSARCAGGGSAADQRRRRRLADRDDLAAGVDDEVGRCVPSTVPRTVASRCRRSGSSKSARSSRQVACRGE